MAKSGTYLDRVQWLKVTNTRNSIGQQVESFVSQGFLWASVSQTNGRSGEDYGSEQKGQDAEIRLRNYPAVSPLDRLYYSEFGETYIVDSIHRGNNELIVQCHTFTGLNL